MKDMNRVFIMGHIGNTPELTISKNGKPYTRLSVATHRTWMNSNDQKEDITEWHSVFVWGPLAERCCAGLGRGSLVFVEGSLSYWKVAEKEYKNAVHGHDVKFLNGIRTADQPEPIDNPAPSRNHNAVAHPA